MFIGLNYLFQMFFVLIVTYYYYKYLKPKFRYLLYGYFFFFIGMVLQFSFRSVEVLVERVFEVIIISSYFVAPFSIIFTEILKYFSLKKFIQTRVFKNGFFFGIGWASLESINYFTAIFFSTIFAWLGISFDYGFLLNPQYNILNFIFFFILNLAINVYIILAITKRDIWYLFYGILYSLVSYFGLLVLSGFFKLGFYLLMFGISLFVIFYHRKKHK